MRNQENITEIDQYVIDFVREWRISKKLTQEDIGNILNLSRSFIKDVESINTPAKFNLRHINALADYFGMSPRDFLPMKAIPVNVSPKEKPKAKTLIKPAAPSKKPAHKKAAPKKK